MCELCRCMLCITLPLIGPRKKCTAYNRTDNLLRHRFKECAPT